jgi:hypothetical protein
MDCISNHLLAVLGSAGSISAWVEEPLRLIKPGMSKGESSLTAVALAPAPNF